MPRPAILKFFESGHLEDPQRVIAYRFEDLANDMATELEGPEAKEGLRKLLEAKDCFVRASL